MKKLVIVDNDGGVDDAWAIFLMLNDPNIEIIALTCVFGNSTLENVCYNNLRLVSQFNKKQIPVYRGAETSLIANPSGSLLPEDFTFLHGRNGFSDVELPQVDDVPSIEKETAFVQLHKLASKYKGHITLVCMGPLTNVALAVRGFPGFADNIKEVFILGGNYTAEGNSTKRPEFNIHIDPEAADIVFRGFNGKCTILPWETCRNTEISQEWKSNLEDNCGASMKFLHAIEAPLTSKKKSLGHNNFLLADLLLAVIISQGDDVIERQTFHNIGVELAGKYTRGQIVILDHLDDRPHLKAKIVQSVFAQKYMDAVDSLKHL